MNCNLRYSNYGIQYRIWGTKERATWNAILQVEEYHTDTVWYFRSFSLSLSLTHNTVTVNGSGDDQGSLIKVLVAKEKEERLQLLEYKKLQREPLLFSLSGVCFSQQTPTLHYFVRFRISIVDFEQTDHTFCQLSLCSFFFFFPPSPRLTTCFQHQVFFFSFLLSPLLS